MTKSWTRIDHNLKNGRDEEVKHKMSIEIDEKFSIYSLDFFFILGENFKHNINSFTSLLTFTCRVCIGIGV